MTLLNHIAKAAGALALLIMLAVPVHAAPVAWQIDTDHSAAHFSIRHMMIAQVRGMFPDISGTATFDDTVLTKLNITARIASLDTGVEKRDEHLKSPDFFDAATYPVMSFTSTTIEPVAKGFHMTGDLTIKGVTHKVHVMLTGFTETHDDPWNNARRGATIQFVLDRRDYNITWNAPLNGGGFMIGNTVDIAVDLEAIMPHK